MNNCPNCGTKVNQGDIFCPNCGFKLESNNYVNNIEYNPNRQYTLTLRRPKEFSGSLIKYKVYLDNNLIATLKNGETKTVQVSSGEHNIHINNCENYKIIINENITTDVAVLGFNNIGIVNTSGSKNKNINNNDHIVHSSHVSIIISSVAFICSIVLGRIESFVNLMLCLLPFVIVYSILTLSGLKKQKNFLGDEYKTYYILNILSLIIGILSVLIILYLSFKY